MGVEQLKSDLRFQLDGLRLHPRRRLVVAAMIGGVVGVAATVVTVVNMMRAGPAAPTPPRPMSLLPEPANTPTSLAEMSAVTGVTMPLGWRLVAVREGGVPGAPDFRTWTFMQPDFKSGAALASAVEALAPKAGGPTDGKTLAEVVALDLGRLSVGVPVRAWAAKAWDVSAAGGGRVELRTLETDQAILARVQWVKARR